MDALPHSEYTKILDKSTTKSNFDSVCSTYEGNQKVKEAKASHLVHHYELFKMKENENNETMYSRFQTLVSGLQGLSKCYNVPDHVKKIIKSLSAKFKLDCWNKKGPVQLLLTSAKKYFMKIPP